MLGIVVMAAMALMAVIGAGSTSATELFKDTGSTNDTIRRGTTIEATLKSGTSAILTYTPGFTPIDTCTSSNLIGKLEEAGGESAHPGGKTLTLSGCSHTTHVIDPGKVYVEHIPDTTNGYVYSSGAELEFYSTDYKTNVVCKTGVGVLLGMLTGAASEGHATFHVNAVLPCSPIYSVRWTGTYTVTNPTGLIVEAGPEPDPETPPGTELYKETEFTNDTLGKGTAIKASLEPESSLRLEHTEGELSATCTGSEIAAEIEKAGGEGSHPSGKVSSLTFSGCSGTTVALATGELKIERVPGTTDGIVTSSGAELTFYSELDGDRICKTGSGTIIGTLTGAGIGVPATLDINAAINCGAVWPITSRVLTGTYTITSPTGLIVEPA